MSKVGIVGLGEIGEAVLRNMVVKNRDEIYGVDIDNEKVLKLRKEGYDVSLKFDEPMEVYCVCVYTSEQVLEVLHDLDYSLKPLVIIESTLKPGTIKKIIEMKGRKFQLAIFPHRYFAPDPEHQVFNLKRVLGCENTQTTLRAMNFLKKYMDQNLIHTEDVTLEIAELCKPLENAYRFMEITIAEVLKMYCAKKNINFEHLRKAVNTKWNVVIYEAREGVGGHCLPKDMKLVNDFFGDRKLFKTMIALNKEYVEWLDE